MAGEAVADGVASAYPLIAKSTSDTTAPPAAEPTTMPASALPSGGGNFRCG
jgi:hypothetical protein